MKEFKVSAAESGQKCIKYCEKILPNAGVGFLHKMLRKKNITLNSKKTDGTERLNEGDVLRFFFSDETFDNFSKRESTNYKGASNANVTKSKAPKLSAEHILYENDDVLLYNKPVGILSQKAKPEDISLNEMLLAYLAHSAEPTNSEVSRPSICNRLDRNTSGIVICGKTYHGLRLMNERIAGRDIGKFYHCIVAGCVDKPILLKGYLKKDEKTNKVTIQAREFPGASYIETEINVLKKTKNASLLEVHLITGKTHQIRSHLAFLGHPIIGDHKYGNPKVNDRYKRIYGLKSQLLHAYRLEFPQDQALGDLCGKHIIAPKPKIFRRIEKEEIHGHVEF